MVLRYKCWVNAGQIWSDNDLYLILMPFFVIQNATQ
jgi:hypothetical protein